MVKGFEAMDCKQITTFAINGEAIERSKTIAVTLEADEPRHLESGVVNLYPEIDYQVIEGFGGSMTETSAYHLSKMDPDTRRKALECYFSENGYNVRFVRVHIDSCDYSLEQYQAVEDPMSDPGLETFSIKRDKKYIIPMLKEAMEVSKQPISVMLSPWSPPACWKTPPIRRENDAAVYGMMGAPMPPEGPSRSFGGSLKPEYYGSWAKYMVKYVKAYLEEGIPVTMLSVQNESIAATNWDSCVWTAEQEKTFLRDYLYPELKAAGLTDKVGLYFWDHNKERVLERALEVIDDETSDMIEGVAFHWYSGDHFEAVKMVSEKFPDKKLVMSECCEFNSAGLASRFMMLGGQQKTLGTIEYEHAVHYAHDIIGNLNAGMNRWIDWNFFVDKDGGPRHVPGGFTAGIIANEDGTFRKKMTHYYVCHFTKYIKPGAKRIGFSRCNDDFEMTAAKNPDGSLAAVFLNKKANDVSFAIRLGGKVIRVSLPANTISTIVIE